jgi:CRISPR-associated endonuclease/helicase Cas3
MRLLQEMRRNGGRWDDAWARVRRDPIGAALDAVTLGDRVLNGVSRHGVANWMEAIDYLVVTHHGLFSAADSGGTGADTLPAAKPRHVRENPPSVDQVTPAGPLPSQPWQAYCSAERRIAQNTASLTHLDPLGWRALMVLARSALILADYTVSQRELPADASHSDMLYANTISVHGAADRRRLNQPLCWHLTQVGNVATDLLPRLARLAGLLPETYGHEAELPGLSQAAMENIIKPAAPQSRFAWQNRAADALARAPVQAPTLIFNLASTGSGKTRMNLRAVCVLNSERRCRIAIALNLRSLTLQTGHALRSQLQLDANDLAVVIGDQVTKALFDTATADEDENPVEADIEVDGSPPEVSPWMLGTLDGERSRVVVGSPLLVSTIDYLVRAGEPGSQRHHLKALLRVVSSDLVLDEVDGYEPEPLAAVLRLVQLTAFSGHHVVCSSATLSQPVAEAVYNAFRTGLLMRQRLIHSGAGQVNGRLALIDDRLDPLVRDLPSDDDSAFAPIYAARLEAVARSLRGSTAKRIAFLQDIHTPPSTASWMDAVVSAARRLHDIWGVEHTVEAEDGERSPRKVSLGLVRVANISTAVQTARTLADRLVEANVACYHAADLIAARFLKEQALDRLLTRSSGDAHIVLDSATHVQLRHAHTRDVLFIVVATPVEEVGRDHDFDWAVLDVSSAQSVVQAGGRVNRHRLVDCSGKPNIAVLRFNYRHCSNVESGRDGAAAFIWPGYEPNDRSRTTRRRRDSNAYGEHDVAQLLPWDEHGQLVVDARVRFDVDSCALAAADDQQIRRRLDPFFGMAGAFTAAGWKSSLMTEGKGSPYRATRLRDDDRLPLEFVLDTDGDEPVLKQLFRTWNERLRRMQTQAVSASAPVVPAHPRAWLSASPSQLRQVCADAKLQTTEGMRVEIRRTAGTTALTAPPGLTFDSAFGLFVMPTGH